MSRDLPNTAGATEDQRSLHALRLVGMTANCVGLMACSCRTPLASPCGRAKSLPLGEGGFLRSKKTDEGLPTAEGFDRLYACRRPDFLVSARKSAMKPTWGGFECLAPARQATSPRPHQARSFAFAVLHILSERHSAPNNLSGYKNREPIDF